MQGASTTEPRIIGRYALYGEIASGGMATVHLGRILGAGGFSRAVAIKRLHSQYARDPEFVAMFLDEARLASRISHPNVVPTLDVVQDGQELLLVMDYVRGASLSRLLRGAAATRTRLPPRVVTSILCDALHGLHAAHEAKGDQGEPLEIVHRDISPQNVIVGTDGVARVLDFGVAKAAGRLQQTREGQIKGKIAYMPPEQIRSQQVTRRADIYAVGVVLWEALVADRLFRADNHVAALQKVLEGVVPPPSTHVPDLPPAFDAVVAKALQKDPSERYATAREMATALEACATPASPTEVGECVERLASDELHDRANRIAEIERSASSWSGRAMHSPPPAPVAETPTKVDAPAITETPTKVDAPAAIAVGELPIVPAVAVPATIVSRGSERKSNRGLLLVLALTAVGFVVLGIVGFFAVRAYLVSSKGVIAPVTSSSSPSPSESVATDPTSDITPTPTDVAPTATIAGATTTGAATGTTTTGTTTTNTTTRATTAGPTTTTAKVGAPATTAPTTTAPVATTPTPTAPVTPPTTPTTTTAKTAPTAPPTSTHGKPDPKADCKKGHGKCP